MRAWIERHQVLAVALFGAAAYILWELRDVFIILMGGYILAAALRPAVDYLARYSYRALAILAVYLAFFGIFFGIVIPSALVLGGEAGQFSSALQGTFTKVHDLAGFSGSFNDVIAYVNDNIFTLTASALFVIGEAISVVIISVYLLYDWHGIHAALAARRGEAARTASATLADSEHTLGSWVRAQLLLSGIVGVLVFIALIAIGVPFAPVLAVLAALFEFIPYAGPFLAAAPAVLIALNTSLTQAIIIGVAYLVIQQIEGHFLVPLTMKRSVRLHPVVVIACLLTGFEILGIAGVILAVPTAVLLHAAARHILNA